MLIGMRPGSETPVFRSCTFLCFSLPGLAGEVVQRDGVVRLLLQQLLQIMRRLGGRFRPHSGQHVPRIFRSALSRTGSSMVPSTPFLRSSAGTASVPLR